MEHISYFLTKALTSGCVPIPVPKLSVPFLCLDADLEALGNHGDTDEKTLDLGITESCAEQSCPQTRIICLGLYLRTKEHSIVSEPPHILKLIIAAQSIF